MGQTSPTAKTMNDATRHVAAGAYVDSGLRSSIIKALDYDNITSIAPNYGINIDAIRDSARAARKIANLKNTLLSLVFMSYLLIDRAGYNISVVFDRPLLAGSYIEYYGWQMALFSALAIAIVLIEKLYVERRILASMVAHEIVQTTEDWIASVDRRELSPNVVIYSGFSPFVGSGIEVARWSFSICLRAPDELIEGAHPPRSFTEEDLYLKAFSMLQTQEDTHTSIRNMLFIDGKCLNRCPRFLPDRYASPITSVEESEIREYFHSSNPWLRHYVAVQIRDWSGELIISLYWRVRVSQTHLFIEANSFVLPPIKETYREVDNLAQTLTIHRFCSILGRSIWRAPFMLIAAPFRLSAELLEPILRGLEWWRSRRNISNQRTFNYGASTSIRQIAASTNYRSFFQRTDHEMHYKSMQKSLLDIIVTFLAERGFDTSDIKERSTSILNNGVIVSGGSFQASTIAVGEKANAMGTTVQNAVKAVTQKV